MESVAAFSDSEERFIQKTPLSHRWDGDISQLVFENHDLNDQAVLKRNAKSCVQRVWWTSVGEYVCMKETFFDRSEDRIDEHSSVREKEQQQQHRNSLSARLKDRGTAVCGASCKSPFLVSVYGCSKQHEGPLVEVMEWQQKSDDLLSLLRNRKRDMRSIESVVQAIAFHVLHALAALHAEHLVHRDVSVSNLFVDLKGGYVKLGDLTHACFAGSGDDAAACDGDMDGVAWYWSPTMFAGTPYYASLEALQSSVYGYEASSDMWSMGILLYRLLAMRHPFYCSNSSNNSDPVTANRERDDDDEGNIFVFINTMQSSAAAGVAPPSVEGVSTAAQAFLASVLQWNSCSRKGALELLQHPWLKDVTLSSSREVIQGLAQIKQSVSGHSS